MRNKNKNTLSKVMELATNTRCLKVDTVGQTAFRKLKLVLISPEGLCQGKIPMTPSAIEPETFRFVEQRLDQLRHSVSQ
jgi:hypothetical protein